MRSFKQLVLLARLLRHGLDRLELLALHHVEIAQHALGLGAHHVFDLLAHAIGGAGSIGDQLAQLVEEPACGLGHGTELWDAAPSGASRAEGRRLERLDRGPPAVKGPGLPQGAAGRAAWNSLRPPLSRHRSRRDRGRAGRRPLVRPRLHGRHPARLAVWAAARGAGRSLGRQAANDGGAGRRFSSVDHARHRGRRQARLRAVLRAELFLAATRSRSPPCGMAACRSMAGCSAWRSPSICSRA